VRKSDDGDLLGDGGSPDEDTPDGGDEKDVAAIDGLDPTACVGNHVVEHVRQVVRADPSPGLVEGHLNRP